MIALALMLVLSVLYFSDLGLWTVLGFWGVFLLGTAAVQFFPEAGLLVFLYQIAVAAAFYITARSSV